MQDYKKAATKGPGEVVSQPRRPSHPVAECMEGVFDALSGEWLLEYFSPYNNAGWIILLRAIWVTGLVVLFLETCSVAAWVVDQWNSPFLFRWPTPPDGFRGVAAFFVSRVRSVSHAYGTELLGIFGGVCAAFYSRFASQWQYLADLYNQIKAEDIALAIHFHDAKQATRKLAHDSSPDGSDVSSDQSDETKDPRDLLAELMNGFIVDAFTLHLARKSLFRSVIANWAEKPRVMILLKERDPSDDVRKGVDQIVAEEKASPLPRSSTN